MTTVPTTTESMISDMHRLMSQLRETASTIAHLGQTVAVYAESPEEQWVRLHGEAVSVKRAAEIIGRTPRTVTNMAASGLISKTPDGNVLIRELARWANSKALKQARSSAPAAGMAKRR